MGTPFKRRWRILAGAGGATLVFAGLLVAWWWFYKLGPSRRVLDPKWRTTHSESEYWRDTQAAIHRGMWSHDDGFAVGLYGDKVWAQWIITHVKPGTSMGCLGVGPCHADYAMRLITNQDVGDKADAWLGWWKQNGQKPQEEWIADGFAEHGVHVATPPTAKQTESLLVMLGDRGGGGEISLPKHLAYNAFRWLRDSGFEPVSFALSKRSPSAELSRGLQAYAAFQRRFPSNSSLGILAFGKRPENPADIPIPRLLTPQYQTTVYVVIFVPLTAGIALIAYSLRRKSDRLSG